MSDPRMPQPRRLVSDAATQSAKPRLLAGSTEGLGSLKIAMTPEQEAAMNRAKEEFAAAQAAQQSEEARIAAEQQRIYEEELRRYEEEKRAYEEFLAAQQAGETAPQPEEAVTYAQPQPTDSNTAPAAPEQGIPTPSFPAPTVAAPTPVAARPAVSPTAPMGGYRPGTMATGRFGSTQGMTPAEPVENKPLWKRPVLYISFFVVFIGIGAYTYVKYEEHAKEKAAIERYVNFAKLGADTETKIINGATPEDAAFILQKVKEETTNNAWMAAVEALHKMLPAQPGLTDVILNSIKTEYNTYAQPKRQQLAYFVLTQNPAPEGLREKMMDFYNAMPDDFKPELLTYMQPQFLESDIPLLIGIITNPANKSNSALTSRAERAVSRVMERAQDKKSLAQLIKQQYDSADDAGKYVFIRLMGKTGDQASLDFLNDVVMNKDSSIIAKRNAVKALGAWNDDNAIAVLMKLKDEPFGKDAETGKYVTEELYKSLSTPGRTRDMSKIKPLIDYLLGKTEQKDKLVMIGALSGNAKTDQWALDILKKFYDDKDDKVSYEAEKALDSVKLREAPKKKTAPDNQEQPPASLEKTAAKN